MIFELRHSKRERERARRESRESELDRTRLHHHPRSHHRPNPKSHRSRRTPAPQRSRHRDRTPDRIAKIVPPLPPSRSNSHCLNLGAPYADADPRSPLTSAKPISPLQYPIHIPSNPSPFSSLLSHRRRSEITPPRSSPMTHLWPISLFLDLLVPFPQFLITLSSSLSQFDRIVWV